MIDEIVCQDCLEGLKALPDNCVDLVVTDPPYLFETRGAGFFARRGCKSGRFFDEIGDSGLSEGFNIEVLKETERVLKATNTYVFCSKNQLLPLLAFYKDKNVDVLVWHKTNAIPTINNKYKSDLEYIVFARDKGVRIQAPSVEEASKVYTSLINTKDKNKWGHPTIKPLPLIERLVRNSSNGGGIVLDPFIGSGTTAVAAIKNGRHYIGFEKNEAYYKIALKRIEQARMLNKAFF